MSENSEIQGPVNIQSPVAASSPADAGLARRKLIRAGLAGAPVLLGLKSQSALATGSTRGEHCKPSVWSSLKGAKGCRSSHVVDTGPVNCNHHTYWAGSTHSDCGKKFHHHATLPKVPFGGSDCNTTGKPVPSLKEVCRGYYGSNTGDRVANDSNDKGKLAKHCAAMYLNVTVDRKCPITEQDIHNIWNGCKDGGTWTPGHGGSAWTRTDCIEYFEYVCKGTKPVSWTWNSQCV
jgi:hypothetical protein